MQYDYRYRVQVTLVSPHDPPITEALPSMYAQTWEKAEQLFERTLRGTDVDPHRSYALVYPHPTPTTPNPEPIRLYYRWGRVNVR